ncbi:MAG TPA: ABC transporter permease [Acidimicrobiales bacterium]|nr:ABC transporter permease [Acidimicrobiales bacterium]
MEGRGRYAARRLAVAAPTLLGLSLLVFLLGSIAGDPSGIIAERGLQPGEVPTAEQIAAVHHELGLDRPVLVRYGEWLGRAVHGDLGQSLLTGESVTHAIRGATPSTVGLAGAAIAVVVLLGVPLGLLGALVERRSGREILRVGELAGASIPGFLLAYMLIYLFSVRLKLLPVVSTPGWKGLVLPAITLAIAPAAVVARLLQTSLAGQLGEEYSRTAMAKGLSRSATAASHALRNALLPVVTVLGGIVARLIEGAVVVELVFARGGIGSLTLRAVGSADYPMTQGVVLYAGLVVIAFNLLVDLSYPRLDPRVRLGAAA